MKVTTYAEFKNIVTKFADGHFRLLIVVGAPGTAKSTVVRELLGETSRWVNASLSAFQFYVELWRNIDAPFVIDDVDNLCRDPAMNRLLKALCDSRDTRRVCWLTASSLLSDGDDGKKPPREFETRSRLVIITNDWKTLNKHIAAVEDRGHIIRFEPSAAAIHTEVSQWFTDREIYDYIGRHLSLIKRHHSMRWYRLAEDWKHAQLDWRGMLLRSWELDPDDMLVLQLLDDNSLTTAERERHFHDQAQGGKSRRTFYYRLKQMAGPRPQSRLHDCTEVAVESAKVQADPMVAVPSVAAFATLAEVR